MKHDLKGQLDLPATGQRIAELLKRKAGERLIAPSDQKPLDFGLFSDDSLQTDLIEMLLDPEWNEGD